MLIRILNTAVQTIFLLGGSAILIWMFRDAYKGALAQVQVRTYGYLQQQHLRTLERYRSASRTRRVRSQKGFFVHLEDLLAATLPIQNPYPHARRFPAYSLYFGAAVYLVAHILYGAWVSPLLLAIPAVTLPYTVLRMLKYRIAIRNSYDVIPAILKLLPEYRHQNYNMRHTLPALVKQLPKTPVRRAISRLSNRLETHTTPEEARRAVRSFQNEIATSWGTLLSHSIERAYIEGLNVEKSLHRLVTHVTEVQKALSDNNLNRVDIIALGFMPGFVLVGGYIFLHVAVTRLSFIALSAQSTIGALGMSLDIGVSLLGIIVSLVFYRPKQDF